MSLSRLSLTDFRSHADLVMRPGPGLVILTGENGAGKTNILEAVSLLTPGRGLRGAALSDMARRDGPGGFGVAATLLAAGDDVALGTGTIAAAPDRRQVRINGAAAAANSLGEWLSVLWLTPAMDRLFIEGASGRRRFLDRLVLALHPGHAAHSARYEAAMRQRNKLLADDGPPDPAWLDALEARMAEHGAAIAEARAGSVALLSQCLAADPQGPFARAIVSIENDGPADIAALAAALREGRSRDAAAGRTLAGPHRADLSVVHAAKNQPAPLCSTGEQKALLLAIILAHAGLVRGDSGRSDDGRPLLLLLDEVAAHLDPLRRAALFERLEALGAQVWMTGTEAALFADAGAAASRFHVGGGMVSEERS